MKTLWRHIAYNYREGGFRQIMRKILLRIRLWGWSETVLLVYRVDLATYERTTTQPLSHGELDFEALCRLGYFKAAAFPETTRERVRSAGCRCHGFFVDGDLVNIAWTTQAHLELEPGWNIGQEGCAGLFDCYTLPAHRSKGYYRDSLILLNNMMKAEGASEALIAVDPDNLPSIRGIERAGFEPLCTARRRRRLGREYFATSAFARVGEGQPARAGG